MSKEVLHSSAIDTALPHPFLYGKTLGDGRLQASFFRVLNGIRDCKINVNCFLELFYELLYLYLRKNNRK